jgi:hypothetical protein
LEESKAPDTVLETSEGGNYLVHEEVVDTIMTTFAQEDDNGLDQEPDNNDTAEVVVEEENDQAVREGRSRVMSQEKNGYNDINDSTSMGDDKVTQIRRQR